MELESETEQEQPLTPTSRLFVQPIIDQVINASLTTEFPLNVDAIKSEIRNSIMLNHPRFCSLMLTDSAGRHYWRRTKVDVDRHVIVRDHAVADSDDDAINDYIADLCVSSPLPTDKPLWEIHLLLAHRTLVFRLHHALGDGISLMSMLLSCCRKVDEPLKPPNIGKASSTRQIRWSAWTVVTAVWYTLVYALEFLSRALWLRDKTTAVSGGAGVELWPRKLATARFLLEDMKIVKRAVADATINDVLVGVISCGLSRYLNMRMRSSSQGLPEGLKMTCLAMVNLRPQTGLQDMSRMMDGNSSSRWGNKFGMLLLPIYYDSSRYRSNPIEYVKRAKSMIDKKKVSMEGAFSYRIGQLTMWLLGAKVAAILNYRILCNSTLTLSNVVGPEHQITLVGNPVKHLRATSTALPHAMTMHMVSYAGKADLQIQVAKQIIPDPQLLAKCFEDALLQMKLQTHTQTTNTFTPPSI